LLSRSRIRKRVSISSSSSRISRLRACWATQASAAIEEHFAVSGDEYGSGKCSAGSKPVFMLEGFLATEGTEP
jgi:hypothetical protein